MRSRVYETVRCPSVCPSVHLFVPALVHNSKLGTAGLLAIDALGLTGRRVLPSRILSQTLDLENFVTARDSLNVLSVWFYNDERSVWQTSDRYRWT